MLHFAQVLVLLASNAQRASGGREVLGRPRPDPWQHRAQVLVLLTSDAARARAEVKKRAAGAAAKRGALPTYTVRTPPARGAHCCSVTRERCRTGVQQASALSGHALVALGSACVASWGMACYI